MLCSLCVKIIQVYSINESEPELNQRHAAYKYGHGLLKASMLTLKAIFYIFVTFE